MNTVTVNKKQISPSKIVCVGRNYVEHIDELGNEVPSEMVLFVKPNSAISQTLPSRHSEQLHYEAELCFVYHQGQFCAVGIGLDLTKRVLQSQLKSKGLPWERAKAFNGSAVFSEFVAMPTDLQAITFGLAINGKLSQFGHIGLMIYSPQEILTEILSFMDLFDGDIVMTGTPKGVGVINASDDFRLELKQGSEVITSCQWQAL